MQADITTDGKRILAKIPWAGGRGKEWAKLVPGRTPLRDADDKFVCWTYPLTMDTCRTFRRVFQGQLTVRTPLAEWAREAIKAGEVLEEMRDGAAANMMRVPIEAPFLAEAINDRPYQGGGVGFMSIARQCILGDEPGLGKTLQTLATLIECDAKTILVGCPRTATRATWERETERWAPGIATFVAQGDRNSREKVMGAFSDHALIEPGMRKMLIINNEMIRAKKYWTCDNDASDYRWYEPPGSKDGCGMNHKHKQGIEYQWPFLFHQTWDAVVIDEAHNLLASTANVGSKNITQGRYGAMQIRKRVRDGGLALALSGTPFRSKLTKAWGTINWCRPDVFTSFWNLAETHFGVAQGRYSRVIQPDNEGNPAKVPVPLDPEAWDAMLRPYYLARTKKIAAPDLPDITYAGTPSAENPDSGNYVFLDMDPKQQKAYRDMSALAEAKIKGGTLSAIGTLAEITRLRQFAVSYGRMDDEEFVPSLPSEKIEWVLNFMQEHEGCDGKILIASQFTRIVHLIEDALNKAGWRTLTLTGATTDRGRLDFKTKFNDPDSGIHAGIINSIAGGESITLDSDCDEMIIVDPLWTDHQEFQLVSRIHRVSRIHNVIIHRLISTGTTEEWMVATTEEQKKVIQSSKPQARRDMALEAIRYGHDR